MGHDHNHAHDSTGRAFLIGVVLNVAVVVIEVIYGIAAHSMALLADAGHNLGDVLGLVLAGGATLLARKGPTPRRTYGYRPAGAHRHRWCPPVPGGACQAWSRSMISTSGR